MPKNKRIEITKALYISELWNIEAAQLNKLGVHNRNVYFDERYYIKLSKLKNTKINEFSGSWNKVMDYFENLTWLIREGKEKEAIKHLRENREAKQLGLGSGYIITNGTGVGLKIATSIVRNIKNYLELNKRFTGKEIFFMIGFLMHNIAEDRMTDILYNIIKEDIIQYNENLYMKTKKISSNDFKRLPIAGNNIVPLALPRELLSKIQVFSSYSDFIQNVSGWLSNKKEVQNMLDEALTEKIGKENKRIQKITENNKDKTRSNKEKLSTEKDTLKFISGKTQDDIGLIAEVVMNSQDDDIQQVELNLAQNILNGDIKNCDDLTRMIKTIINYHSKHNTIGDFYELRKNSKDAHDIKLKKEVELAKRIARDIAMQIDAKGGQIFIEPSEGRSRHDLIVVMNGKTMLIEFKKFSNRKLRDGWNSQTREYSLTNKFNCIKYIILDETETEDKVKKNTKFINEVINEAPIVNASADFVYLNIYKSTSDLKDGETNPRN